jgi:hypothetical protein
MGAHPNAASSSSMTRLAAPLAPAPGASAGCAVPVGAAAPDAGREAAREAAAPPPPQPPPPQPPPPLRCSALGGRARPAPAPAGRAAAPAMARSFSSSAWRSRG